MSSEYRAGYVAIVGEPNVGKSTLMNRLVGAKLSIVTRKPQTTRKSVLGIHSTEKAQAIFIDTPGVLTPRYLLQEKLVGYVADALRDADLILLMLDATDPTLHRLAKTPLGDVSKLETPVILLLNKVDLVRDKKKLLPIIAQFAESGVFREIIPLSALKGENSQELLETIEPYLPHNPPFYDPETLAEQPERFFVSELIREQILLQFREEIPYSVEVEIVEFTERTPPDRDYILADIVVERDSQKGILIGKGGEALKRVGERSRAEIEEFLQREVFLELYVKVKKDWRSDEGRLRSFGY